MEQYRTEDEQVEALRRWWNENGRSTIAAIVIGLAAAGGWQAWQGKTAGEQERASDIYQELLRNAGTETADGKDLVANLATQLKSEFSGSTYAQFAALHMAAIAAGDGNLEEAEAQLRWVLGNADKGSDTEQVAQLRLARVLAATGDAEQALQILAAPAGDTYGASYAAARGDILFAEGRKDEAREAYTLALGLAGGDDAGPNLSVLQQKLQSLSPIPARTNPVSAAADAAASTATDSGEEG